ncbi:DUF2905 domain-containing protein [Peptoclostridium litorale]|uniref:DUF2905 domain-containing protein n=1 Tax=Peptoclostridium litorale TaxID=1557 RepID=UPI0005700AA3|nr:DUF2905 domain-containing protein [Peptoclostridium litorale]
MLGKNLIMMGIVLIILGIIITLGAKLGIGKLPGDILIKRGNMTFYFPVATSILLSIILTLLINFLRK